MIVNLPKIFRGEFSRETLVNYTSTLGKERFDFEDIEGWKLKGKDACRQLLFSFGRGHNLVHTRSL